LFFFKCLFYEERNNLNIITSKKRKDPIKRKNNKKISFSSK
jgi:hypothetical protein